MTCFSLYMIYVCIYIWEKKLFIFENCDQMKVHAELILEGNNGNTRENVYSRAKPPKREWAGIPTLYL